MDFDRAGHPSKKSCQLCIKFQINCDGKQTRGPNTKNKRRIFKIKFPIMVLLCCFAMGQFLTAEHVNKTINFSEKVEELRI
jgi:hypothetical protein